jgi:DNA-binding response OmpR family regulator
MKILLVEDDRQLSASLGDFFEYVEGWQVIRAYRPDSALKALEKDRADIDLIVLDIMMPPDDAVENKKSDYGQNTGILLLEKLRPLTGDKIPIVVLSARQDLNWLKSEGKVQEYLQKTLTPEEIVEGIQRIAELHYGNVESEEIGG